MWVGREEIGDLGVEVKIGGEEGGTGGEEGGGSRAEGVDWRS